MNMRDLQAPPGVWFPAGSDAVGVESWAIKVKAKVIKDEVGYQLEYWKAEYETAKAGLRALWDEFSEAQYPDGDGDMTVSDDFHDEWSPRRDQVERDRDQAKPKIDHWQKWHTYLANMPDDELLSLTKKDYETFFADRDQREGKL